MLRTTVGQLLINASLPPDLVDHERVLDKAGVKALLRKVAETRPEEYRAIAKKLSDVGRDAAFSTGGYSFGLKALRQSVAVRKLRGELQTELNQIYGDANLSDDAREQKIINTVGSRRQQLWDDVFAESKADMNPLAYQAVSGARGSPVNVNSLRGADLLYTDHRGQPLPIPVLRNYSQGLKPYEYFAGAFGARRGIIDLKNATSDAGFLAKQLLQTTHRLLVSADDAKDPYDESNPRGYPVDTEDMESVGGMLAHPAGGYKRNTELTPRVLKDLRSRGINEILVRSPTVGGPFDGGVYSRDVGRREKGRLAPLGDWVGPAGAQALSEPLTQSQISSKHSGGIAGASAGAIGGFKGINSLVQVPKVFPGGAAHAQRDGTVEHIEDAPQGGKYVTIGGERHYVNRSNTLSVKKGDKIEAGDVLSDGVPNPAEIVRHKGIGEGRRYFVNAFRQATRGSNVTADRRNIELLSRGLINHVRLTDEVGDWVPDDVVPYQLVESTYKPRMGHLIVPPNGAVGKYLERPVLHYSVGTKIQPSMLDQFNRYNVKSLYVHADPPPFEPEMIRGMANVANDPDWMVRMLGSYQKSSLLDATHRGLSSNEGGTSFVPALARGENFGRTGLTKGWESSQPRSRAIDLDDS